MGGLIASVTPIITFIIEYIKWKKITKIEHLRIKRNRLEKAYQIASDKLNKGMKEKKFSSDMLSDFDFIFPKEVTQALENFMNEKDKSEIKTMRLHFYSIMRAMKKTLADIDELIENQIK
ncbi:MAG: hypothetical protein Q8M92_03560 [Candidatus Subteraquimicrobiales bacterium]|nr:hypothetical protein [Candidatus Subteraquimicrobiales bacterium]